MTTPVGFVVVAALVVVVGVVLLPQLLGFTFFLLPFLWSRTAAKRRRDGEGGWFPGGPDA